MSDDVESIKIGVAIEMKRGQLYWIERPHIDKTPCIGGETPFMDVFSAYIGSMKNANDVRFVDAMNEPEFWTRVRHLVCNWDLGSAT
jgi:hypothetical protein